MSDSTSKEVTQIVASMRKSLAASHGLDVPHSALRAAYLTAKGKHPHSFGKSEEKGKSLKASKVPTTSMTTKSMYLTNDEVGCLRDLSLDAEGCYLLTSLPAELMARIQVKKVEATVPSIAKYGLPDYIAHPRVFFEKDLGMKLHLDFAAQYTDTRDDSGDSCALAVELSEVDYVQVVAATLAEYPDFEEEVAEWVGLHYRNNFEAGSPAAKADWVSRFLEFQAEAIDLFDLVNAKLEWVYPDEDSDHIAVRVDTSGGHIFLKNVEDLKYALEHDASDLGVRLRIVFDDELFDARYVGKAGSTKDECFRLTKDSLGALNQHLLDS